MGLATVEAGTDGAGQKRMKQIDLGSQGLRVPAIGLGCMGMSEFYGSASEARNLGVLDRAADIGCTFWDTSDIYGPFTNEILLSRALKGRRERITLATKFGVSRGEDGSWQGVKGGADYVRACCDASLKRLETDYIDLYYQHRVDPETPIEETVGAMAELVEAGKVRYIGLSEADPQTIDRAHAVHPVSALQTEYSLWSRDVEAEILPTIQRLNIGFVAYSPPRPGIPLRRHPLAERSRTRRLAIGQSAVLRGRHRPEQPAGRWCRRNRRGHRRHGGPGRPGLGSVARRAPRRHTGDPEPGAPGGKLGGTGYYVATGTAGPSRRPDRSGCRR